MPQKAIQPQQQRQQRERSSNSNSNNGTTTTATTNRPRNHLILDATKPFEFTFDRFGVKSTVVIHQTPSEDTWPGGALWDLGVLLAKVLVQWTHGAANKLVDDRKKTHRKQQQQQQQQHDRTNKPSSPALDVLVQMGDTVRWKETVVLELGCGVGLTGLVAAMLGAKLTVLTDLGVVVEHVTQRNVEVNTQPPPSNNRTTPWAFRTTRAGGKVIAMPLCWGNNSDESAVQSFLMQHAQQQQQQQASNKRPKKKKKKKKKDKTTKQDGEEEEEDDGEEEEDRICPDWIMIGDVAYQHRPGAPSHFDALISSMMRFVGPHTRVLFGTRMRMPASKDLLDMFRQHLHEIVEVKEHDVDHFLWEQVSRKHNMSIHVFGHKSKSTQRALQRHR